MSKGTLLYVGGFELPDRDAAAQRVLSNGKLLRELGYTVVFCGDDPSPGASDDFVRAEDCHGFPVYQKRKGHSLHDWARQLADISALRRLMCETVGRPDAILLYNHPAAAMSRLRRYCRANRIRLLADCTEWYVAQGNPLYRLVKNTDTRWRMQGLQPRLDGVIAISRYLYDYYVPQVPTLLLPPLVDLEDPKWSPFTEVQGDTCRLLYAGSPGRGQKDRLATVLQALSLLGDRVRYHLDILGLTEEEFRQGFGWGEAALPPAVAFHGRVPHVQAIRQIAGAHFTLFIRESNLVTTAGFPTKFVESISAGTPVLTNLSSNLADYLVEGKNGYALDISSVESLAQSLQHALSLGAGQVNAMKRYCRESRCFDYRQFLNSTSAFLSAVL